ncbi:MAG: GMC oxidoreductase [Chthoniobacteraceae bacterium]
MSLCELKLGTTFPAPASRHFCRPRSRLKNVKTYDNGSALGMAIHEMGTARMGRDPKTSVLNARNQIHAVKSVFMADGACMSSAGCVNPSLTYMALTARAADFAVEEMKKLNL